MPTSYGCRDCKIRRRRRGGLRLRLRYVLQCRGQLLLGLWRQQSCLPHREWRLGGIVVGTGCCGGRWQDGIGGWDRHGVGTGCCGDRRLTIGCCGAGGDARGCKERGWTHACSQQVNLPAASFDGRHDMSLDNARQHDHHDHRTPPPHTTPDRAGTKAWVASSHRPASSGVSSSRSCFALGSIACFSLPSRLGLSPALILHLSTGGRSRRTSIEASASTQPTLCHGKSGIREQRGGG